HYFDVLFGKSRVRLQKPRTHSGGYTRANCNNHVGEAGVCDLGIETGRPRRVIRVGVVDADHLVAILARLAINAQVILGIDLEAVVAYALAQVSARFGP